MMAARIGDIFAGTCFCHRNPKPTTGKIVSGSCNIIVGGMPLALLGGTVITSCGHTASIVSAAFITIGNSLGVARLGSTATGCAVGTIVSGCSNVMVNA